MQLENFVTVAEAAKVAGLSASAIYKLIREKKIEAAKWGSNYLVDKNSVLNYQPLPVGRPRKIQKGYKTK